MNPNLIISRLWLGNAINAKSYNCLSQRNINVIVNCTKDIPFTDAPIVKYKYRVKIDDDLSQREIANMARAFHYILPIIHAHWMNGDTILIHCAMGIQRSAIVTMTYLWQYQGFDPHDAYNWIKSIRAITFYPRINFKASFDNYTSVIKRQHKKLRAT